MAVDIKKAKKGKRTIKVECPCGCGTIEVSESGDVLLHPSDQEGPQESNENEEPSAVDTRGDNEEGSILTWLLGE